jgi:hypothetical protein
MGVFGLGFVEDFWTEKRGQSLAGFHTCAWLGVNCHNILLQFFKRVDRTFNMDI